MSKVASDYLISTLAVVGLIVLTALNRVGSDVSIPLIVALAGVHTGANISDGTGTTIHTGANGHTITTGSATTTGDHSGSANPGN